MIPPVSWYNLQQLDKPIMKKLKILTAVTLALVYVAAPISLRAEDDKDKKVKPYPLDKCIVSDEKLGGMGKPFVFTYEGQEIKLCCKSCQKDFKKEPAKYLKKLKDAEAAKAKK
jgi:hypothetical protein